MSPQNRPAAGCCASIRSPSLQNPGKIQSSAPASKDVSAGCDFKTFAQRCIGSHVDRLADQPHPRRSGGKAFNNREAVVGGRIVDDNDFVGYALLAQ